MTIHSHPFCAKWAYSNSSEVWREQREKGGGHGHYKKTPFNLSFPLRCPTKVFPDKILIMALFENHRKSLIQYCERSELRIYTSSLKRPKMGHFGEFLKTWSLLSNSATRQVSFDRTENGGKCQNWKIWVIFKHCRIIRGEFWWFSNTVFITWM